MKRGIYMKCKLKPQILIAITIGFLIVVFGGIYVTKFTIKSPEAFLKDNSAALDLNDNNDFSSFKLMDSSLKDNDVFLFSSESGCNIANLDFKMIKYLNSKAGVNYCISQYPHSIVTYLNKYLQSGDEKYLDYYMFYFTLFQDYNQKDFYNELKNLYKYNKSLPESQKLKYLGIGPEIFGGVTLNHLYSLIPDNTECNDVKNQLKFLSEHPNEQNVKEAKKISLSLQKDLVQNEAKWKICLKNNFDEFKFVNNNILKDNFDKPKFANNIILKDIETYTSHHDFYDKFLYFLNKYPNKKFYGIIPNTGAFQKEVMSLKGIGAFLNEDKSPVKGKTITIQCGSPASYNDPITQYIKKPFTLLKLTGSNSPFEKNNYAKMFPIYFSDSIKEPITNYFQYVINLELPVTIQRFTSNEMSKFNIFFMSNQYP